MGDSISPPTMPTSNVHVHGREWTTAAALRPSHSVRDGGQGQAMGARRVEPEAEGAFRHDAGTRSRQRLEVQVMDPRTRRSGAAVDVVDQGVQRSRVLQSE